MGKAVKISDDLYNRIKEIADKKGVRISDEVNRLLAIALGAESEPDDIVKNVKVVKKWRVMYDTTCPFCGQTIKKGEFAVRIIYEFEDGRKRNEFYHPECYMYGDDELLAKYYVKKRYLQKVIKALEKKANELADKLSDYELRKQISETIEFINKNVNEIRSKVFDAMMYFPNDRDRLNELRNWIQERFNEITEKLKEIEVALSIKIIPKSRRKRIEEIEV